ncbi:type IV toxin-antitoxin system AbiEi family antitoxin domain-containing protein [Pedobacter heparinus]|uniref:Uncharacterized protein n=1 Tax=Pedobacter heparinus (strain ATCC 13125 / DSM 2366 / CIP 104194 / JCM 7457 / NBRC 12017 / NCIMB 9290 / NRRL B-14731 / HIM 762-3) TaxID=485917 RepID=C6Y1R4_PEDHD|nr:type IV toxin-antitoxin system AbiEi family antitoxin domain-containing protein [Pedobacter heparinus]ACU05056.1 hypothetical protein Phep_2858 [Pedobacter heparinus DSM 2366]
MEQNELSENPLAFLIHRKDGVFTTEDLMRLGLTRDEANKIMEQLCRDGVVQLVPVISGIN